MSIVVSSQPKQISWCWDVSNRIAIWLNAKPHEFIEQWIAFTVNIHAQNSVEKAEDQDPSKEEDREVSDIDEALSHQLHQQPKGLVDSKIKLYFDAGLHDQDDVQQRHHGHPLERETIKGNVQILKREQALVIHPAYYEIKTVNDEHGEIDPIEEIFEVNFEALVVHLNCFQSEEEDAGYQADHIASPDGHRVFRNNEDLSKEWHEVEQEVHDELLDEISPSPFKLCVYHVPKAHVLLNICSEFVIDQHQVVCQLQLTEFLAFNNDTFSQAPQLHLQLLCPEIDWEMLHRLRLILWILLLIVKDDIFLDEFINICFTYACGVEDPYVVFIIRILWQLLRLVVPSKSIVFSKLLADSLFREINEISRKWNEWILVFEKGDHEIKEQSSYG